jgi:peptidoglycan/xylan/chitin deacetylase (PgdA/CDA1 family)
MEVTQSTVEAGHELGNHSCSHQHMIPKSRGFIAREIEVTDHLIRAAGFEVDVRFSAPYSEKLLFLLYCLRTTERLNIALDVEPVSYDDSMLDAYTIIGRVAAQTRRGPIILMHVMSS